MLSKVISAAVVGLSDKAVEEAKERDRSTIRNFGADFPARRITVNLAPADLPKEGHSYDLPIALGILITSGQLQTDISKSLINEKLSLDGRVRPIYGAHIQTLIACDKKLKKVFIPTDNTKEAAIVEDVTIYPVDSLKSLFFHLTDQQPIEKITPVIFKDIIMDHSFDYDLKDIKGQKQAKRALENAAAGAQNMLFKGPSGAGKTLLARTLAHRGVLFLDEFPEFPRNVPQRLRQPIENNIVSISRAKGKTTFSAKYILIASLDPYPCGYLGDNSHQCICSATQITRYGEKISGPLLDKIDIHLDVTEVKVEKLTEKDSGNVENSQLVRTCIQKARDKQNNRYQGTSITANAELNNKTIKTYCNLSDNCIDLLRKAGGTMGLSGRAYYRIIKLSRTIANLADEETILPNHIAEALQYRPKGET